MRAIIFGASGGLAVAVTAAALARGWKLDLVTRRARAAQLALHFADALQANQAQLHCVEQRYTEFVPERSYDAVFFLQSLFCPAPLVQLAPERIGEEIAVGLEEIVLLTQKLLVHDRPQAGARRDYCYMGSTSAYAGFKDTAVYCAVKHGLLGFVRAMNDEYRHTDARFWLFSMGTMRTEMGMRLVRQDPESFLPPAEVAERILAAIDTKSNLFEPEVIVRRRTIRFLEEV